MSEPQQDVVLEARNVSKRYGGNLALNDVTFRVRCGSVNVLIGENGAGKSTLMRLLAGAEQPSSGEIFKGGQQLEMRSPRDATAAGIAIVHQELSVLGNLDVAENVFAGRELVRSSILVDRTAQETSAAAALKELGKPIAVRGLAGDLSLGNRQVVELARSLAHGADVLILDEPTSALSAAEATSLFHVIADLKARGVAIVYISHRLHELLYLGDYFTVMRDGRIVGEGVRGSVDRQWIVERMSGRALVHEERPTRILNTQPMLEVSGVSIKIAGQSTSSGVNLTVGTGEIVGIYGLLGSGRTELLETLAGLRKMESGTVTLASQKVSLRSVAESIAAGITLAPEDRQRDGLVPALSIRENMSLASLEEFAPGGWLRGSAESARVRELAIQMHLAAHDLELPVTTLSGGNQQKVVLARCLMRRPKVLLLDEPTRGVDVGAKAEIYRTLHTLAAKGLSILFATSEIEEARLLADRIVVMAQGRFTAEFANADATDEALFAAASPTMEAA
ncbi:sugar ABC transporter ATP-binding protein [Granulicella sp. WH15]|uniref:sugar ABC transporter ATP-binding protein n=1 Tax=Granulicella sp. WH15 TaxID=2602070 RepID=UPI00136704CE|nr:sugar ABC transporter ATP-binding protein [Granulicella sp. WH15]QHN03022.1 sugar ABC transporter ATP-binding protein [Granulicella sp. WH15]